jgi:hypothetical protein
MSGLDGAWNQERFQALQTCWSRATGQLGLRRRFRYTSVDHDDTRDPGMSESIVAATDRFGTGT